MNRRAWLVVAACGCGATVLWAAAPSDGPATPPPVPVETAVVVRRTVPVEWRTFGTVEPSARVEIKAQVSGVLTAVFFAEGARVQAGDRLFAIDPRPWEATVRQAEANLARDRVRHASATREAERQKELLAGGLAAQEEDDQARTVADALGADVASAEAALAAARLQLGYCTLRAPMTGRTGTLLVHSGNLVRANEATLTTLLQLEPVYVDCAVPEKELALLLDRGAPRPLDMRVTLPGSTNVVEVGRVTLVENAVDRETGTIRVRGTFANAAQQLWPGQFVGVKLVLRQLPDVLVVPTRAIQTGQRGTYVFVVQPDEVVRDCPVTVGEVCDEDSVVTGELQPGDRVVVDGQIRLAPGARVQSGPQASEPARKPAP